MSKNIEYGDLKPSVSFYSLNRPKNDAYSSVNSYSNNTFSAFPSRIVDEPLVKNITKGGPSKELHPSCTSLLKLMASHLDISLVYKKANLEAKLIPNSLELIQGNQCNICFNLKFEVVLACHHAVCVKCFRSRILNYFKTPSIETFKELRCEYCCALPTRNEVFYVFGENHSRVNEFFGIDVEIKCKLCERTLVLMKDFYPELKCLHICKDCYIDQLFSKSKNCIVCRGEFSYRERTLNRVETCAVCQKTASVVDLAFKSYENGMICFNCQNESARNNESLPVLYERMRLSKKELMYYLNKRCPQCHSLKPISEIQYCNLCGTLKCDECSSSSSSLCSFCSRA